jgi:ABC-type antimicrobial peptide transport system permease subunit
MENQVGKLAGIFAVLAIFISCLGLFGLAAFMAERRTKEIGIRKVLGATLINLWAILSKEFIWLVLAGCMIACPLSFWLMNDWLQSYDYRINISWWVFFVAGMMAILIALLTVSTQAIKAAIANPVNSLRSE